MNKRTNILKKYQHHNNKKDRRILKTHRQGSDPHTKSKSKKDIPKPIKRQ